MIGPPPSDSGRLRVLELLRSASGALGVADLAVQTGLHPNTVRFHLNRLVATGLAGTSLLTPGLAYLHAGLFAVLQAGCLAR